jgi:integrase
MVRVRLKGTNSRTKVLKDGSTVTYWYAWKGGPRLRGEPGDPEFLASYHEAISQKKSPPAGVLLSILQGYQASTKFDDLAERTKSDYVKIIKTIELEFGDFPLVALADRGARGLFMEWRDKLAKRSRRQADYAWVVLGAILSWALDRGLVAANPCQRGGRLYRGSRRDKIWTLNDEIAFLDKAPQHLHLALQLALWTGQRQGDLLSLPWSAYDGKMIRLQQSKTGARVAIPVGSPLKAALDTTKKCSTLILVTKSGTPWTEDGFRSSWRKACKTAGIVGVTFNDLRGTAVTRLALAECTEAEMATITGHTLRDVRSILAPTTSTATPLWRRRRLRSSKRERKLPTGLPTVPECSV